MLWEKNGNYPNTLEDMNQVVRIKPEDSDSYWLRSLIYERMGKVGDAIKDLNQAMQLSKNDSKTKLYASEIEVLKIPKN